MFVDKPKRIKNQKAIEKVRLNHCEYCYRYTVIDGKNLGHVHHIKSRGSGGGDLPENLIHLCYECHDMAHKAIIPKDKLSCIAKERELQRSKLEKQ